MTGSKLPPDDHVVRYVRGRLIHKDDDDNVLGIFPQALELRPSEQFLSVTWLEHFSSDYEQGLSKSAEAIRRQLNVRRKDGFAVGGVGQIHQICSDFDIRVRILHEPEQENSGHSALRGLPRDDMRLLDLLAAEAFTDTRVANAIAVPSS